MLPYRHNLANTGAAAQSGAAARAGHAAARWRRRPASAAPPPHPSAQPFADITVRLVAVVVRFQGGQGPEQQNANCSIVLMHRRMLNKLTLLSVISLAQAAASMTRSRRFGVIARQHRLQVAGVTASAYCSAFSSEHVCQRALAAACRGLFGACEVPTEQPISRRARPANAPSSQILGPALTAAAVRHSASNLHAADCVRLLAAFVRALCRRSTSGRMPHHRICM